MSISVVQWVGGKGQQLEQLLPLIPHTNTYVEPFGGGGVVLLNRERSEVEVYNDLNDDVVNLFRVMRDDSLFRDFEAMLELTMWSKEEFRYAITTQRNPEATPVERAWALYVVQNQGISGAHSKSEGNWSRAKGSTKNTEKWWARYPKLARVHHRLRHVQVDSQDALSCMVYWDGPQTTFYVDPPYVLDTRHAKYYAYEMENAEHERLVEVLLGLSGGVVLSGYEHPVYRPLEEAGWVKMEYGAHAYAKVVDADRGEIKPVRIEVVWRNPRANECSIRPQLNFDAPRETSQVVAKSVRHYDSTSTMSCMPRAQYL